MSPSRPVATSTLWQMLSQAAMALLSIITVKFVAMGLSKDLAGLYNSSYGYLQLFGILADFGLYAVAVREISKSADRPRVLRSLIILRTLISAVALGAALLIVWSVPGWMSSPLALGVTIASLVPIFTLQAGILRTVFQVEYKLHYVFIAEVTQRLLTTTLIAATVLISGRLSTDVSTLYLLLLWGGLGAVWLWAASSFFVWKLWKIRPLLFFPKGRLARVLDAGTLQKLFLLAFPFGIAYLFLALYRQSDVTLIAILRDDFDLQNAYYGFVQRMTDMAFIIPTFLLNSTLPAIVAREKDGRDTRGFLGRILLVLILLGIVAFLFGVLWSRELSALLTTPDYLSTDARAGTDTALRLVSIPMLLNGIILYGFYMLLQRHAWRQLVATLAGGALLSLILNLWWIPRDGFVGAAHTSIVVHIALALVLVPQAQTILPARLPDGLFVRCAFFAALAAATLVFLKPLLISGVATIVFLGVAVALLGVFGWMLGLRALLSDVPMEADSSSAST